MTRSVFRASCAAALLVLVASLAGTGCASSKVPAKNRIATAMFAIRDARVVGAEIYAPEQLQTAESLLGQAQTVDDPLEAERYAAKSTVHAQLAAAIAALEGARQQKAEAKQVEREADTLLEETTRAVEEGSR